MGEEQGCLWMQKANGIEIQIWGKDRKTCQVLEPPMSRAFVVDHGSARDIQRAASAPMRNLNLNPEVPGST